MTPNLALWSDISSLYIGRRCEVLIEMQPEGRLGHAWLSASGDPFISLRYDSDMLFTWLHETAHHVLGHVKLPRHETQRHSTATYSSQAVREFVSETLADREREADQWAEQALAAIFERTPNAHEALWINEE